ncbi:hypothetical protein CAPTEDRAFT_199536 [Capitella teleta]|uniref:Death domain-containing protein n=1 Tax=Capitella teleta TaxID=283909 RepID=R7UUW7_CAPTE|nr:hypothetical protein CAPTEDRAFT_199536 [Capitella teleta]|eukprot:ELU07727.1 hypothetical protein CAPTEDRAFT_199536 [Capitella teleta]
MAQLQDIIQSANFLTDSDDDRISFMQVFDKHKVQTIEEIEAGFSALCAKLREHRIKGDMDQGVYMAGHCVKCLMDLNFDSNQRFVDVLRACYGNKLVPGQLKVANRVWCDTKVDKYMETLEGQDLVEFIKIFKTDYSYQNGKDNSMELRYYESLTRVNRHMITKLWRVLDTSNSENMQQAETANEAFAEASLHNLKQVEATEYTQTGYIYADLSEMFLKKFDRFRDTNAMYLKIPHLVKPHLEIFIELVRNPNFPRHKRTVSKFEACLRALSAVLVEIPKEITGEVPAFVNLMFDLALTKHEATRELAKVIGRKFTDAKKIIIKSVQIDCERLKHAAESKEKEAQQIVEIYLKRPDQVPTVLETFSQFIAAIPDKKLLECIVRTLRDGKTKDIFKNHVDGIQKMMEAVWGVCRSFPIKKLVVKSCDSSDDCASEEEEEENKEGDKDDTEKQYDEAKKRFDTLNDTFEFLVRNLKSAKSIGKLNDYQMDAINEAIYSNNHYLWQLSYNFEEAPWQESPEKFVVFLEGVIQCAESKKMMTEHGMQLYAILIRTLYSGINSIKFVLDWSAGLPLSSYIPAYIKLAKTIEGREYVNDDDMLSSDGQLLLAVLIFMSFDGHDISQLGYLIQLPFKYFDHTESHIQSPAEMLMHVFSRQPNALLPQMDMIMEKTMKNKTNITLLSLLKAMLPLNLSLVSDKLDDVVECCVSTAGSAQMMWLDFVRQISEHDAGIFKSLHVDGLKKCIYDKYATMTVLGILHIIAKDQPQLLRKHESWMLEMCSSNPDYVSYVMQIIPLLSTGKKDEMTTMVNRLTRLVETSKPSEKVLVLFCIRSLALQDKAVIQTHVRTFESLKSNRECAEVSQQLIDIAKGLTAKELGIEIADQKVKVTELKRSMMKTNKDIGEVKVEIGKQDAKLAHVTVDVRKAQEDVSELQNGMNEMGAKVDEIDHKTMTNAPDWARDVSLLLNKPSDADWRLLAQRLGYCNNDIRAWACQADPCMAVLSEWYANHKAREATFGIMKALEEMDSGEALKIVKKAAEEAENVVSDDTEMDVTNPPPVFLSYQWGHQEEAKMLKEHLEAAGFRCWMDLGQMGGGDKLFAKIDSGMRSAAVVICCVTHKYAKSDNCNRETSTNKASEPEASITAASPQVFLSYQWGRQSEVEVLYNKLTRLGYTCWMDIHQMGGGDSLYDKIDRGIRGCCVTVSCVTPKYAMSANCRKEVTLAEALKKPIIPLMLDTIAWPPEGPMSMVLAPLAFIDCREEVSTWNGHGFQTLLKQISKQMKPARTLGWPNLDQVNTKPFDAKKQWRKVKNVGTVVATSQACNIL